MQVFDCFQSGTVVKGLESREKFSAIHELLRRAPVVSSRLNLSKIETAVIEREKIYTTGIGRGVAIAHGKTSSVDDLIILLGISREGIDFNSLDGEPVHLLFLIANPPEKSQEYLVALSTLARVLRSRDFSTALVREENSSKAEKLIAKKFRQYLKRRNN